MKVVNLTKIYKVKKGEPVKALDGVTFDLPQKGMVFLTGKSGSGKTTLLNLLSGLDTFDDGDIILGDKSLKGFSGKEADSYRNGCCGFVFQDYNLLPEFTVAENVSLALEIQGKQASEEEISQALKSVDLEGYENRKVTELSGGQKQRIAIVRALVKNPEVIFADEPTGALDSKTGDDILSLLKKLSEQKLVVIVSHEQEFAQKYADRIIELKDGKILSDTAAEYCENDGEKPQLKKSGMPFNAAFKIGMSASKLHPFRLLSTVLLSVLTFALLGVCMSTSFTKADRIITNSLAKNHVSQAIYAKHTKVGDNAIEGYFTDADLAKLRQETNFDFVGARAQELFLSGYANEEAASMPYYDVEPIYSALLTDEQAAKFGFKIYGTLPKNGDKIALSKVVADRFVLTGVDCDGTTYSLDDVSDLVGKTIRVNDRQYEVCGVVDTKLDKKFDALKTAAATETEKAKFMSELFSSLHCAIFFDESYFEKFKSFCEVRNAIYKIAPTENSYYVEKISRFKNKNALTARCVVLNDDKNGVILPATDISGVYRNYNCDVEFKGERYANFGKLFGAYFDAYLDEILDDEYAVAKSNGYGGTKEQYKNFLSLNLQNPYGKTKLVILCDAFERFDKEYSLPTVVVTINLTSADFSADCVLSGFCDLEKGESSLSTVLYVGDDLLAKIEKYYGGTFYRAFAKHDFKWFSDYRLAEFSDGETTYLLANDLAASIREFLSQRQLLSKIFGIVSAPLTVVAVLMLYYFVYSGVKDKSYTVGVLRILGCKPFDVITIFLIESLFIGISIAVLSVAATFGICGICNLVLNRYTKSFIILFAPDILSCVILLLGVTLISFLTGLMSSKQLLKGRPLDYTTV